MRLCFDFARQFMHLTTQATMPLASGVPTVYVCSVIDENGRRDAVGALSSSEMGQTKGVTTQTLEKFINTLKFFTSKYIRR